MRRPNTTPGAIPLVYVFTLVVGLAASAYLTTRENLPEQQAPQETEEIKLDPVRTDHEASPKSTKSTPCLTRCLYT